jgi:hypothetical protein
LAIIIITSGKIADHLRKSIRLIRADIIGEYRIDTNFYNGKNAQWQYHRYRFTITPQDSILFYVGSKDTIIKTFRGKILYSDGPPDVWKIQEDITSPTFHVIKTPPTLYRGHSTFYYVFKSNFYGNMFFRKIGKR